jgi:hypothetical protein
LCRQGLFSTLQISPFGLPSTRVENALLPPGELRRVHQIRSFGTTLKPRYIVGTEPLDQ